MGYPGCISSNLEKWVKFNFHFLLCSATPQYHVFVYDSNGIIIMNDNTTNTNLSLSLRPDDEYNIRLVATGQDLPSEVITVTVPQGTACTCT